MEKPYLFRTYENLHKSDDPEERQFDRNPDLAHDIPIWQVARATAAAPTYFKPVVIDGLEYLDGGFGANNPCTEIYQEVRKMNNNAEKCAGLILSVGTGKNNKISRLQGAGMSRYWNYLNFARKWASDSEKTHEGMLQARNACTIKFEYFRLNVGEGLDSMKLDEWRARGALRVKTGRLIGRLRSPRVGSYTNGNVTENSQQVEEHKGEQVQSNVNAISGDAVTQNSPLRSQQAQTGSAHEGSGQTDATAVVGEIDANSISRLENAGEEATSNETEHQNGDVTSHSPAVKCKSSHATAQNDLLDIPEWFREKNKTLETIREHTTTYLAKKNVQQWIEQCAKILVDGRRLRAKSDPGRWEKACFGAWYQCNIEGCPRGEHKYPQRKDLRRHLLDKHKLMFSTPARGMDDDVKLKAALDKGKILVQ